MPIWASGIVFIVLDIFQRHLIDLMSTDYRVYIQTGSYSPCMEDCHRIDEPYFELMLIFAFYIHAKAEKTMFKTF